MGKPIIESLKDAGRIVVLAIVPILIADLSNGNGINWQVIAVTAAIAGLKFIDSMMHETAKEEPKALRNEGMLGEKGLTGF